MTSLFLRLNFILAAVALFGSLYLSEVLKYPPCNLCWYQRICLYPLTAIFASAIWNEDRRYPIYALPLAVPGLLFSIYHNLLYYGLIPAKLAPCTKEISCSARQLELFGILTIP